MKINNFKNKEELYGYLIKKFIVTKGTLILRGSMINRKVKNYSDFDFEIYNLKPRKPHFEIVFINSKICLVSIWFRKYREGKITIPSKNIRTIYGKYFSYMNYIKDNDKYDFKQWIKRENQAVVDWMFKYLRTKDKISLLHVQKRII